MPPNMKKNKSIGTSKTHFMKIQLTLFALALSLCVEAQPPGVRLPQPKNFYGTFANPWMNQLNANKEISKKHTFQVCM